jgi:hypothetical protein
MLRIERGDYGLILAAYDRAIAKHILILAISTLKLMLG